MPQNSEHTAKEGKGLGDAAARPNGAGERLRRWRLSATPQARKYKDQWPKFLLSSSTVGFGVMDRNFRFLAVNKAVSIFDGIPIEEHLGRTIWEVVPAIAEQIGLLAERVFSTGQPIGPAGVVGEVPTGLGYWMVEYFPIKDGKGKVQQVAALVVELLKQKTPERPPRLAADAEPGIIDDEFQGELLRRLSPAAREGTPGHPEPKSEAPVVPLLSRELQVLRLIAEGKSNKKIASLLFLSVRTVETYRARLLRKLGLHTAVELTRYALRHGIASL